MSTLQAYANDMLAVEREVHAALDLQSMDDTVKRHPAATQLVARTKEVVERHITELQQVLQRLGTRESVVKKAVGAALGVAAGLYARVRPDDQVSRMLRDDYTALTFTCVCYEMLHVTSLALKDAPLADLALAHLRDLTPIVMDLGDLLPGVVVDELAAEGKIGQDRSVVEQSVRNVRDAWSQSAAAH